MYIPVPYFKSIPYWGDLILDHIFIKDKYPLLFTCINEENLYLCLCYDNRISQKWAIAPIEIADLKKLVFNEISIRDALKVSWRRGCIATWNPNEVYEKYTILPCQDFSDDDLPDDDVFLDDENAIVYYEKVVNRTIHKNILRFEKNVAEEIFTNTSLLTRLSFQTIDTKTDSAFCIKNTYDSKSTNNVLNEITNNLGFNRPTNISSNQRQEQNYAEKLQSIINAA